MSNKKESLEVTFKTNNDAGFSLLLDSYTDTEIIKIFIESLEKYRVDRTYDSLNAL